MINKVLESNNSRYIAVKHLINRIQVAVSPSTTSKYWGSPYIDTKSKASDHIDSRNRVITGHRSGTWPRTVKDSVPVTSSFYIILLYLILYYLF